MKITIEDIGTFAIPEKAAAYFREIADERIAAKAECERLRREVVYERIRAEVAEDTIDAVRQALGLAAPVSVVDEVARLCEARGVGCQCGNEAAQRLANDADAFAHRLDALVQHLYGIARRVDELAELRTEDLAALETRLAHDADAMARQNAAYRQRIARRMNTLEANQRVLDSAYDAEQRWLLGLNNRLAALEARIVAQFGLPAIEAPGLEVTL